MLSRSSLRRTALTLLSLLLFGQGVLAASSCDWLERSPAQAITGGDLPPCHETAQNERNPNLCLADCLSGMQSLDKPSCSVHAMPSAPVLVAEQFAPARGASLLAAISSLIVPPGAPPPRILYHQFLI